METNWLQSRQLLRRTIYLPIRKETKTDSTVKTEAEGLEIPPMMRTKQRWKNQSQKRRLKNAWKQKLVINADETLPKHALENRKIC